MNVLPIQWVEPVDISNAVLFLASDEARYITGLEFTGRRRQHDPVGADPKHGRTSSRQGRLHHRRGARPGPQSHAIRLAQEGADIIAVDLCGQIGSVPVRHVDPGELAETVKEVEALDRRIVATQADVRDYAAVKAALDDGVAQLGRLDIVRRTPVSSASAASRSSTRRTGRT